jgi:hypothetical protein
VYTKLICVYYSPGTVQVKGDYTATPTAVHAFEVGGISNGAYDVLSETGNVHLDGALNVSLINGFEPSVNHPSPQNDYTLPAKSPVR